MMRWILAAMFACAFLSGGGLSAAQIEREKVDILLYRDFRSGARLAHVHPGRGSLISRRARESGEVVPAEEVVAVRSGSESEALLAPVGVLQADQPISQG